MSSRSSKRAYTGGRRRRKRSMASKFIRFLVKLSVLLMIASIVIAFVKRDNLMRMYYTRDYNEYVEKYSKEYDLDPLFVHAVIQVESGHNPRAQSHRGAKGLMQIMADTGYWVSDKIGIKDFNEDMLYNPETNIRIGTWLLSYLIKEFEGNEDTALAAYNGGIGNVNQWLKTNEYSSDGYSLDYIPFKETAEYVDKINKMYERYKELY